jgi:hypothetical protein
LNVKIRPPARTPPGAFHAKHHGFFEFNLARGRSAAQQMRKGTPVLRFVMTELTYNVRANVEAGSRLYTDRSNPTKADYRHEIVDHGAPETGAPTNPIEGVCRS